MSTVRALLASMIVALAAWPASAADGTSWVVGSRSAAATLGARLMAELQAGLARSPAEAIAICRDRAPAIAAEVAAERGVEVGRTALRLRNPANAPAEWQRVVLEEFAARLARGEDPATLEYAAVADVDGGVERRWMKPVFLAPLCVTCHGVALAPGVEEAIAEAYPQDRATGFSPGELRGAFVAVSRGPAR
jgi:hypothetical protein